MDNIDVIYNTQGKIIKRRRELYKEIPQEERMNYLRGYNGAIAGIRNVSTTSANDLEKAAWEGVLRTQRWSDEEREKLRKNPTIIYAIKKAIEEKRLFFGNNGSSNSRH